MTDDLVAFLRSRLDDDERIARAASDGPWRPAVRSGLDVVEGDGWTVCNASNLDTEHIARHDPARVLAEVEAKRQMLRDADDFCTEYEADTDDDNSAEQRAHCWRDDIRRNLATSYADHTDYREEWRPSS